MALHYVVFRVKHILKTHTMKVIVMKRTVNLLLTKYPNLELYSIREGNVNDEPYFELKTD